MGFGLWPLDLKPALKRPIEEAFTPIGAHHDKRIQSEKGCTPERPLHLVRGLHGLVPVS